MADRLILEGTTSLELSAKGSGSDVRSWAKGQVGQRGAQLFINNIAEPGNVDTIINLHNGEVGIGTATPSAKLHVETSRPGPLLLVRNTSGSDGIRSESLGGGHGVSAASVSHTGVAGASETGIGVHGLSNRGAGVSGESNSGPGLVGMTVQGANVIEGRRINNLVFAVTQAGAVLADGPFGGPADFAEMLPVAADTECEPGDVLMIGADGSMARANTCHATNVAGVYSTRPGFLGDMRHSSLDARASLDAGTALTTNAGPDDRRWIPVALMGVVPVKVTAERGAIRPGDLLAASCVPGHARRAEPVTIDGVAFHRPGTVLGKALQPLESGTGVINVLLTM
jgi:hypothetical protein